MLDWGIRLDELGSVGPPEAGLDLTDIQLTLVPGRELKNTGSFST